MLQKNKNNKKVALSLIHSRKSFLLCQMKSFTYTENFPSDVIYSSSSVSFQKVLLLFVSPFPLPHFSRKHTSALSLLEGLSRKHRFHLLPGARRVRQALALGADAAHTHSSAESGLATIYFYWHLLLPFYGINQRWFLSLFRSLSRTGPFLEPL